MNISDLIHSAILRGAALLVPRRQRKEWLAEWRSELWYVRQALRNKQVASFCFGAFKDALWLTRNSPRSEARRIFGLESPVQCMLFLTVLAAASLFLTNLLPGVPARPSPYRDAREIVMIAPDTNFAAPFPTIRRADYQAWTKQATRLFTSLAYYQPILSKVPIGHGETADLSVARTSDNLFDLLNLPVSCFNEREYTARLILSHTAWRKYFDSDPHVAGRVLEIAGQPARVAGVIPEDSWRLPGQVDAWLLEDEHHLAALPADSKGFVVGRVRTPALRPQSDGRWHMYVPNENGGSSGFSCVPLAEGVKTPLQTFAIILVFACLILPVTTSLSLGEYPENSNPHPWPIRLRRWIFLAAKIALLLPVVYCGQFYMIYLGTLNGSFKIPVPPLLAACVFAFRWVLIDQRRRCPVCLRLLTNPAHIGWASQHFLGWYGTELMCNRGHGLLHVPEIPTSWSGTQKWLYLDRSWSGLFPYRP